MPAPYAGEFTRLPRGDSMGTEAAPRRASRGSAGHHRVRGAAQPKEFVENCGQTPIGQFLSGKDVILHPRLAVQITAWLSARGETANPAVFPRGNTGWLRIRSIQLRIRLLGERAGLCAPLHPHALRHAHATGLMRVGVSTAVIQLSMNHHALATTERYLHGDLGLVRDAVNRLPALPVVASGG